MSNPGPALSAALPEKLRFVARQPILDRQERVYGYEILFRDGLENVCRTDDPDQACRSTLDRSLLIGLDQLCDGKRAFLNCTREVLLQDFVRLFAPEAIVVEVLETTTCDEAVVEVCRRLRSSNYQLALDDFVPKDPRKALLPVANWLKVDWPRVTPKDCRALIAEHRRPGLCLLAEKIETREDFQLALDMGFDYFQGYFFAKPAIIATEEIPANKLNALQLLRAVSRKVLDLKEVEKLIKLDASLCYRLLRYLNSPLFFFATEIRSVRHALMVLGEVQVRKWISLVVVLDAGRDSSNILLSTALARARFCELAGAEIRHIEGDFFFLGLMSLIDAILSVPMAAVVERMPLLPEVKQALLGEPSRLLPILQLACAEEGGKFERSHALSKALGIDHESIRDLYWQSVMWAREASRT